MITFFLIILHLQFPRSFVVRSPPSASYCKLMHTRVYQEKRCRNLENGLTTVSSKSMIWFAHYTISRRIIVKTNLILENQFQHHQVNRHYFTSVMAISALGTYS